MDWTIKVPTWAAGLALLVIAASFGYVAWKQPDHFEFASLGFGQKQPQPLLQSGAVIAFNRSERSRCPEGWRVFEEVSGRFIVGAGPHSKNVNRNGKKLSIYPSFLDAPENAVGGAERTTLAVDELPTHRHGHSEDYDRVFAKFDGGSYQSSNIKKIDGGYGWVEIASDGKGKAHENMPPYIALYFCIQTSE